MAKIDYCYHPQAYEYYTTECVIGMVIAEKVDDTGKYKQPRTFPHYDFSYVIRGNHPDGVYVRDCGHNNIYWLSTEDLKGYELVRDWHPNATDGVGDFVNDALLSTV